MFRHIICLSLMCVILLQSIKASPVENKRQGRSIWPFSSPELKAEDLISEENRLILKKAGLEKSLDLSRHPLWKIHKYEGIDVKPVHIETELIKPKSSIRVLPDSAEVTAAVATKSPIDLSILNDLGGLAAFLPEPKTEEEKASDLIVNVIKKEEQSHPGFFKKLWWKLFGTPDDKIEATKNKLMGVFTSLFSGQKSVEENKEEDVLTIYLPETQGSYAAVFLPSKSQDAQAKTALLTGHEVLAQISQTVEPNGSSPLPNHGFELSKSFGEQQRVESKPVVRPVSGNSEFSRSQAWIQSWNPHAAYSVHVQGPGATSAQSVSKAPQEQYRRKVSEDVGLEQTGPEEAEATTEGQVQVEPKDDAEERGRDILRSLNVPESLLEKIRVDPKDVQAILNDKESASRASERLRALQREFEMRKDQLSYAFAKTTKPNDH